MIYTPTHTGPTTASRVVGNASDARWRACKGSAYRGRNEDGDMVFRIDSLIAHNMEREMEQELHER